MKDSKNTSAECAVKERPILFSGAMVRAILAGRKTQTRRVVKLRDGSLPDESSVATFEGGGFDKFMDFTKSAPYWQPVVCPYGKPGDRLWVRETHFEARKWRHAPLFAAAADFIYRADYEYPDELRSVIGCHHWRPSIFMPREASRITLEIVSVRVERLHDISKGDALAEGIERRKSERWPGCVVYKDYQTKGDDQEWYERAVDSYRSLWESINGPESWAENPWVWVVEFKRL